MIQPPAGGGVNIDVTLQRQIMIRTHELRSRRQLMRFNGNRSYGWIGLRQCICYWLLVLFVCGGTKPFCRHVNLILGQRNMASLSQIE